MRTEYHVGFYSKGVGKFLVFAKFFSFGDAERYQKERNTRTGYEHDDPERMLVRPVTFDAGKWEHP